MKELAADGHCLTRPGQLDLERPRFVGENLFAHFRKQGHVEPDLVAQVETRGL